MIVVTVELDSANGPQYDCHLFTMVIGNDGSAGGRIDSPRGNYDVYLGRRGVTDPRDVLRQPLRTGRVENHARKSAHPGTLVAKALKSVKL